MFEVLYLPSVPLLLRLPPPLANPTCDPQEVEKTGQMWTTETHVDETVNSGGDFAAAHIAPLVEHDICRASNR